MKAIFLAAALSWDLLFVFYLCHIIKLALKLRLKIQSIACKIVKEKIESIWANKTICQLNQLF